MFALLASVLSWLLGLLTRKPKGPTADERAGIAEARLEAKETNDARVQAAIDAGRAVERDSLRDPTGARAPDPNSRD